MSTELDHIYIERVLSGDKDAFKYFVSRYQEMAIRIAMSIVKDELKSKHVVQSSFIHAFKNLASFKQQAKFSTWLYRIIVNESIKYTRKQKGDQLIVPIEPDHSIYLHSYNDAIDVMEIKEKKDQIQKVLLLMKPKERLLLELFYLSEKSIAEIEEITGFSNSNIKVLLHRARKSFAAYFKSSN